MYVYHKCPVAGHEFAKTMCLMAVMCVCVYTDICVYVTGNPVAGHEFAKTMCLMAVGTSLLRIEDQGIVPEIREQVV